MTKKEIAKKLFDIGENVIFEWDFTEKGIYINFLTNRIDNKETYDVLDELYQLLEDIENSLNCYDVVREVKEELYRMNEGYLYEISVIF